ncbi:type I methionyl aminopeptidase [Hymenobacter busanensis]|uniref:Methionine aminopeptidase n=1 Tax=Hymenobacter busanensis TaxID=2607656 RepID=A0A7L5A369_9BACT|nr:type I methionyl aminopeptidase [Hymenobacter busanensis]KAA9338647.1 type I methionyl aminopeptidase [Hymenobacter busanensis]QHJ08922.1 type I methionyl aminopeptidase [Hymenobacter busanensis]
MILYKTEEEIELIRASAQVLAQAHGEVAGMIREGITTRELDKRAEEFIRDHGAQPSFKGYNGFPSSLCISPNEVVVHGFPGDFVLKSGDVISVDCGVKLNGYHSDSAYTYPVGDVKPEVKALLEATKESLYVGIEQAIAGNRMGDLSFAIQDYVEKRGYSVVRELVGHGLGKSLHEKPDVPNYGKRGSGLKLQSGLVLAIEPMVNLGVKSVVQEKDGWTIRTKDRQPSAHFEHTVVIRQNKAEILTSFAYIEKALQQQQQPYGQTVVD